MSTFYFKRTHEDHRIEAVDLTERTLQRRTKQLETLLEERRAWHRRERIFQDALDMLRADRDMLRADCLAACQDVDDRDVRIHHLMTTLGEAQDQLANLRDAVCNAGCAERVDVYLPKAECLGVVRTTGRSK